MRTTVLFMKIYPTKFGTFTEDAQKIVYGNLNIFEYLSNRLFSRANFHVLYISVKKRGERDGGRGGRGRAVLYISVRKKRGEGG